MLLAATAERRHQPRDLERADIHGAPLQGRLPAPQHLEQPVWDGQPQRATRATAIAAPAQRRAHRRPR
jgi:hypothetical protein